MSRRHPFAALSALLTAALLLMISGPGCSAVKSFMPGNKPDSKLPPQELIVGGGFQIDYTARRNGTAILADRNRGQILVTKSMAAGETYQFNFDPNAPENAGLFGTGDDNKLSEARPTLYFLPEAFRCPRPRCPKRPTPTCRCTRCRLRPSRTTPPPTTGPKGTPYGDAPAVN